MILFHKARQQKTDLNLLMSNSLMFRLTGCNDFSFHNQYMIIFLSLLFLICISIVFSFFLVLFTNNLN